MAIGPRAAMVGLTQEESRAIEFAESIIDRALIKEFGDAQKQGEVDFRRPLEIAIPFKQLQERIMRHSYLSRRCIPYICSRYMELDKDSWTRVYYDPGTDLLVFRIEPLESTKEPDTVSKRISRTILSLIGIEPRLG